MPMSAPRFYAISSRHLGKPETKIAPASTYRTKLSQAPMDLKDRSHHIIQDPRFSDHLINFINRRFSVFQFWRSVTTGVRGVLARMLGYVTQGFWIPLLMLFMIWSLRALRQIGFYRQFTRVPASAVLLLIPHSDGQGPFCLLGISISDERCR